MHLSVFYAKIKTTKIDYTLNVHCRPDSDTVDIVLDWAYDSLVPEGTFYPDQASFDAALAAEKFKARHVSIYLYGYSHQATVHAVNEITLMGR